MSCLMEEVVHDTSLISIKDYEDYSPFINVINPAFVGWTIEEKLDLLQAIKTVGSIDIASICKDIPTKTSGQIRLAILGYRKIAFRNRVMAENRRRNKSRIVSLPRTPLASWATFLTESYSFKDLQTEISTALRLIADMECIPPPVCTENVNIRELYHVVANAAEGKCLRKNTLLSLCINKGILNTALIGKSFIQGTSLRYILDHIDTSDEQMRMFIRPTLDTHLLTIQHIALQNNFNPLHIEERYLKSSKLY